MTSAVQGEAEVCESLRLMALSVFAVLCEVSLLFCTQQPFVWHASCSPAELLPTKG